MATPENIQNREAHKEFVKNGTAGKTIKLEIKRQDGPDGSARWDKFEVPWKPGMNVISAMMDIATNPVTVEIVCNNFVAVVPCGLMDGLAWHAPPW